MPKKGNAYLAGTVHVAKEVQTIQRYQLEPYMSEKRVKPESATVHVAKCFPVCQRQAEAKVVQPCRLKDF